jgi:hypothetical protein
LAGGNRRRWDIFDTGRGSGLHAYHLFPDELEFYIEL